jgi:protease I
LWLLTPSPEVLRGRRVVCNTVVLADVLNAGATYVPFPADTPEPEQVFVDGDLVTNTGWHATELLVDTIKDIIVKDHQATPPTPGE